MTRHRVVIDQERRVAGARPEPAPNAPVFFLSYSRAGRLAPRVQAFHQKLSEHIAELMAVPAGCEPGFIDRELVAGQVWAEELAFALGHCQVFVPLLSAPYLQSKWCAREWNAFARRTVRPLVDGAHRGTSVIPVVWNVLRHDAEVPDAVSRVQLFIPSGPPPDVASAYRAEGMYGLPLIGDPGRGLFDAAVWRLAQQIVQAAHERWIEPDVPADLESLSTEFGEAS
ncbi:TIR-like protein FxsC [Dactylosporangium sp. CS-033363]|uniref:TIR-like protein FxsC n=1 Tax=Dactylosporangium sp. CS-033363 TaxID=3239935 RepID=UPI003D930CE0